MSDLDTELEEGKQAAKRLAQHLINMGAAMATLNVFVADEQFKVMVRHIPVVLEDEVDTSTPSV